MELKRLEDDLRFGRNPLPEALENEKLIAPAGLAFNNFVIVAITVAVLYFAREILVPIALAGLLSFVLAPLVRLLQRWRLPRSVAVMLAVAGAVTVVICLGTMVMVQINQLARDLPRYQTTLGDKIHNLRDVVGTTGPLKNAADLLKDLSREFEKPGLDEPATPPVLTPSATPKTPVPVEVHQPPPGASETLVAVLQDMVRPFTTMGIVLLFVIFFLFQREDLRNRFIRLAGSGDIERTTSAMDDAGQRLGKLFMTQLILNAVFGFIIGSGLALIGVPSASLWGLIAMVLRFVPYIGALMAAVLPLTLAAAVDGDWSMAIWTATLFAVVETLMGQVIEPFIYGHSAGLSPVAIVVSAAFWTWLWGPLGLLLSTPLTLCLVVLARHVDRLQFIDIMLGDQPALTPQQAAYQRMLTGDPIEAIEQARAFLKEGTVAAYYEEILIGALGLAQVDAERGRLDDVRLENIFKTVSDVVEDLAEHGEDGTGPDAKGDGRASVDSKVVPLATGDFGTPVFCMPGLGRLDECGVLVVADVLRREGINARVAGTKAIENYQAASICVCYLEHISKARLSHAVRKLSRKAPGSRIVVCLLTDGEHESSASQTDPEATHSLRSTVAAFEGYKSHSGRVASELK
jgi:predicted PurR-regulated permease PerM